LRHLLDELRREREPVDERGIGAVGLRLRDVAGVGRQDRARSGADLCRHCRQRAVLRLGRRPREDSRGGARRDTQLAH